MEVTAIRLQMNDTAGLQEIAIAIHEQRSGKSLLLTTDLRISEICERVGFSDVSSLSRYFRREVGLTPTEYRKNSTRG